MSKTSQVINLKKNNGMVQSVIFNDFLIFYNIPDNYFYDFKLPSGNKCVLHIRKNFLLQCY